MAWRGRRKHMLSLCRVRALRRAGIIRNLNAFSRREINESMLSNKPVAMPKYSACAGVIRSHRYYGGDAAEGYKIKHQWLAT